MMKTNADQWTELLYGTITFHFLDKTEVDLCDLIQGPAGDME